MSWFPLTQLAAKVCVHRIKSSPLKHQTFLGEMYVAIKAACMSQCNLLVTANIPLGTSSPSKCSQSTWCTCAIWNMAPWNSAASVSPHADAHEKFGGNKWLQTRTVLQQMQHDIQLRCGLKLLASPVAKMDLISVGIH